jgi:H+/gluconate symporter-like permease
MGIVFLLLSLGILVFLCFKGVPIFISAFISGVFLLVTSGLNPVTSMTTTYATGLGAYFGKFFFIFVLGSLFGKLTEVSGAADSIAKAVIEKLGDKFIVPAIVIAGVILTYGGVSVFVAMFALLPMMVSMFKKANISRTLLPAAYFAGAGTATGMMPGSPQIQNLIPGQILGTPANAAFVPGMIAAVFEMVLVFLYLNWAVKNSKAKGYGFVMTEKDKALIELNKDKKVPGFLIAIAPMLILLIALNGFKLQAEFALFVGIISAMIIYCRQINWKDIWKHLGNGTKDGTGALFNTSAVVGFGSLVQLTPAFKVAIDGVTSLGGNPLISAGIAVTVLAGICGSGSGGLGIAMPILAKYYVPLGVNIEALHRVSALASLGLDSLPHNGLVVSVLNVTEVSHKEGYKHIGIVTVLIPLITLVFMIALFAILPGWM